MIFKIIWRLLQLSDVVKAVEHVGSLVIFATFSLLSFGKLGAQEFKVCR